VLTACPGRRICDVNAVVSPALRTQVFTSAKAKTEYIRLHRKFWAKQPARPMFPTPCPFARLNFGGWIEDLYLFAAAFLLVFFFSSAAPPFSSARIFAQAPFPLYVGLPSNHTSNALILQKPKRNWCPHCCGLRRARAPIS